MAAASPSPPSPRRPNNVPVIQEEVETEELDTFEDSRTLNTTCYDLGGDAMVDDTGSITRGNAFAHVESVEIIPKRNKDRKVLLNPMTVLFPESKYKIDM